MESFVSCTEAARLVGADAPRRIADGFYQGLFDESRCPIVSGRRLIPMNYIAEMKQILKKRGWLKDDRLSATAAK